MKWKLYKFPRDTYHNLIYLRVYPLRGLMLISPGKSLQNIYLAFRNDFHDFIQVFHFSLCSVFIIIFLIIISRTWHHSTQNVQSKFTTSILFLCIMGHMQVLFVFQNLFNCVYQFFFVLFILSLFLVKWAFVCRFFFYVKRRRKKNKELQHIFILFFFLNSWPNNKLSRIKCSELGFISIIHGNCT